MGRMWLAGLALSAATVLVFAACSSAEAPTASFGASSVMGPAPLVANFSDTSVGAPASWAWDFGDGATSTDQSPSHRYTAAGTYDVSLTVTSDAGSDSVTLAALVTVEPGPAFELTVVPTSGPVGQGNTHRFVALIVDAFGNAVDATIVWSASRGGTIDALGVFTAANVAGFFPRAIGATVEGADGLITAEADVEVALGQIARIEVSGLEASRDIGDEVQLIAQAFDASGNELDADGVGWAVDGGLNAISAVGVLAVGTQAGEFEVTATIGGAAGVSGSAGLVVLPGTLARLVIEPQPVQANAGESVQLNATATDEHGNELRGVNVSWRSTSDAATVSASGRLTASTLAGAYGPTVEATAFEGEVGVQATASLTVAPAELAQVVVGPLAVEIGRGMTQQLAVIAGDRFGNRVDGAAFNWSAVEGGSVDEAGLFTAGDEPGDYEVTVSVGAGDDAPNAVAKITVLPERISFISGREDDQLDIYLMDLDGSNVRRLTDAPTLKSLYSWSADGRRLAYDELALGTGIVLTDDQRDWTVLIQENEPLVGHLYPAWAPDGTKIAFVRWDLELDLRELYVMDADGGNLTRLLNAPDDDVFVPAWSPDGRFIVYDFTPQGQQGSIHVIRADGSDERRLTTHPTNDTSPAWSPDGRHILFTSIRDGDDDIWIMEADGTDERNLTDTEDQDRSPDWSPDGSRILFYSDRDGDSELYVMDADGSNVTQLTDNDVLDIDPRWLPPKAGIRVSTEALQLATEKPPADLSVADVTAAVRGSIVRIETNIALGSGFIIDVEGLVLTNNHVVLGASEITVRLDDGTELEATVVGRDLVRDMAVLRIEPDELLVPVELGIGAQVRLGSLALAIGFPLGTDDLTITQGLVSAVKVDDGRGLVWLQTDAAVNPGNSGGPLVDLQGRVIGIVSAKFVDVSIEGVGFAISVQTVATYIERLKAGETLGQGA